MHEDGEAGMCQACFQSLKMAGLPGVEGLGVRLVNDITTSSAQNHTPTFFGKQLLSHLVLYSLGMAL